MPQKVDAYKKIANCSFPPVFNATVENKCVFCWRAEVTGNRKAQCIATVVDRCQLPVNILFDNMFSVNLGWRLAAVRDLGADLDLDAETPLVSQCSLKLVRQYSEIFYVVNHIVHGQFQQLSGHQRCRRLRHYCHRHRIPCVRSSGPEIIFSKSWDPTRLQFRRYLKNHLFGI